LYSLFSLYPIFTKHRKKYIFQRSCFYQITHSISCKRITHWIAMEIPSGLQWLMRRQRV
jgi:hypothetical protein